MIKKIITIALTLVCLTACNDYLDIQPVGKIIPTSLEDYRQLLTAAYNLSKNDKELLTYRADELKITASSTGVEQYRDIYLWNDDTRSAETREFSYVDFYTTIFYTNEIINNKNDITDGKTDEIDQLVGEAHALRALQYFELINLFAKPYNSTSANSDLGVPIVTAYDADQEFPRGTIQDAYNLIISDINQAETLLNVSKQETGFNYRFSIVSLKALKSNVYLHLKEWQEVIDAAKEGLAIKNELQNLNTETSLLPSEYDSVESILALDKVASFDIKANSFISDELIGSYNQTQDLRFGIYFEANAGEFKTVKNANTKYRCTYRVADLYLMLAEAQAELNELTNAKETLMELVNNRYNASGASDFETNLTPLNQAQTITTILEERKREVAIEGKRWFDLRRTTQPEITKTYNANNYTLGQGDSRYTLPFPKEAVISNPLLQ